MELAMANGQKLVENGKKRTLGKGSRRKEKMMMMTAGRNFQLQTKKCPWEWDIGEEKEEKGEEEGRNGRRMATAAEAITTTTATRTAMMMPMPVAIAVVAASGAHQINADGGANANANGSKREEEKDNDPMLSSTRLHSPPMPEDEEAADATIAVHQTPLNHFDPLPLKRSSSLPASIEEEEREDHHHFQLFLSHHFPPSPLSFSPPSDTSPAEEMFHQYTNFCTLGDQMNSPSSSGVGFGSAMLAPLQSLGHPNSAALPTVNHQFQMDLLKMNSSGLCPPPPPPPQASTSLGSSPPTSLPSPNAYHPEFLQNYQTSFPMASSSSSSLDLFSSASASSLFSSSSSPTSFTSSASSRIPLLAPLTNPNHPFVGQSLASSPSSNPPIYSSNPPYYPANLMMAKESSLLHHSAPLASFRGIGQFTDEFPQRRVIVLDTSSANMYASCNSNNNHNKNHNNSHNHHINNTETTTNFPFASALNPLPHNPHGSTATLLYHPTCNTTTEIPLGNFLEHPVPVASSSQNPIPASESNRHQSNPMDAINFPSSVNVNSAGFPVSIKYEYDSSVASAQQQMSSNSVAIINNGQFTGNPSFHSSNSSSSSSVSSSVGIGHHFASPNPPYSVDNQQQPISCSPPHFEIKYSSQQMMLANQQNGIDDEREKMARIIGYPFQTNYDEIDQQQQQQQQQYNIYIDYGEYGKAEEHQHLPSTEGMAKCQNGRINNNNDSQQKIQTMTKNGGDGINDIAANGIGIVPQRPAAAPHQQQQEFPDCAVGIDINAPSSNSPPPAAPDMAGIFAFANRSPREPDEIDTLKLAKHISQELKRYSIPQAIFAQRVLCRSQGTLSDLLRNPKPWTKLKSGRETFRRMAKWLQEPELQRMSALRLAACKRKEEIVNESTSRGTPIRTTNGNGENSMPEDANNFGTFDYDADSNITREISMAQPQQPQPHRTQQSHRMLGKKPRLVFTEVQRRALQAIFKETKRPSRELQQQIAEQLQLDPTTVANYFMNARRRGHGINGGNGTGENGQIGANGCPSSTGTVTDGGSPSGFSTFSSSSSAQYSTASTPNGMAGKLVIKLDDCGFDLFERDETKVPMPSMDIGIGISMKKEEEEEEEADSHTEKKHNKNGLNVGKGAEDDCDNATNNGTTTIEGKSFEVPSNGAGFNGNFERLFDSD